MVDGEVTPVGVPPKQVVLLFIYDQFLQGEDSFSESWWSLKQQVKRSANSLRRVCAPEP